MTTPASPNSISAQQIDLEANKRPGTNWDGTNPDPAAIVGTKFPTAIFGDDPAGAQWANVLERNATQETSFDRLRNKQNAYTFYDASNFYVYGGSGESEAETITPGIRIDEIYSGGVLTEGMWFSVDVGIPSGSGSSSGRPSWNVTTAGNYNGSFEVWRVYFRVNSRILPKQGHNYERIGDVGSGNENLSPGEYNATAAACYYNFRPNFTRSSGNIRGNRVFVYYNDSKTVYASAQYDGFSGHDQTKARVYILKIQFWPPTTKNSMNFAGNGKSFGGQGPVNTNQVHLEYLGGMAQYMAGNPPITPADGVPSLTNLTKVSIPAAAPNITTNGQAVKSSPGGGGCFDPSARVTMYDGTTKPISKVKVGEYVKDRYGRKNKVSGIHVEKIGNNKLYSINGGKYFISGNHPIVLDDSVGWGFIDPKQALNDNKSDSIIVDYIIKNTSKVDIGSKIITSSGVKSIDTIKEKSVRHDYKLYNLMLEDDLSYIVEDHIVLSDVESEVTYAELAGGFDSIILKVVERAYSKDKKFGHSVAKWFIEHYMLNVTTYHEKKKLGKFHLQGAIYTGLMIAASRVIKLFINKSSKDIMAKGTHDGI